MVLQNCQNFTEMTSNMIYIVVFCLKYLHKINLSLQCPPPLAWTVFVTLTDLRKSVGGRNGPHGSAGPALRLGEFLKR